jgi:hypothetical protein
MGKEIEGLAGKALRVTRVEAVYGVNNCKDELKGCNDRGCRCNIESTIQYTKHVWYVRTVSTGTITLPLLIFSKTTPLVPPLSKHARKKYLQRCMYKNEKNYG